MLSIPEEQYQKNAQILRQQWTEEFEETLEEIEDIIKDAFYTGIWGVLFNRIMAGLFSVFFSRDIRKRIFKQFEVILEASREFNGNSEVIVDKYFDDYLVNDPGFARIKKKHKKLPDLLERIKNSLLIMVKNTYDLLKSHGDTYNDLLLNAYDTKAEAAKAVFTLIDDADVNMEFTVHHNMVKIPSLIRKQTIRILRQEIVIARDYYQKKLDTLYGN